MLVFVNSATPRVVQWKILPVWPHVTADVVSNLIYIPNHTPYHTQSLIDVLALILATQSANIG